MGCSSLLIAFNKNANNIQLATTAEVTECSNLGNITVETLGRFGKKIGREKGKVEAELQSKAIWQAAKINATAVVPITEISRDGNRTYVAYKCQETL